MARVLVRGRRGEDTEVEEERAGRGETEAVLLPRSKGFRTPRKLGEARKGSSLETLEVVWPGAL